MARANRPLLQSLLDSVFVPRRTSCSVLEIVSLAALSVLRASEPPTLNAPPAEIISRFLEEFVDVVQETTSIPEVTLVTPVIPPALHVMELPPITVSAVQAIPIC